MSTDVRELLSRAALPPSRAVDTGTIVRAARRRTLRRRALIIGAPLLTVVVLLGAAGSSRLLSGPANSKIETRTPPVSTGPTRGTMPAVTPTLPDGTEDPSQIPDFIATLDRGGKRVGYVKKQALLQPPDSTPMPVYGEDLTTIVGHMYSGRGFVPLGQDPSTVPEFPSTTTVISAPPGSPNNHP